MFDFAPDTDHALMQSPGFLAALRLCGQNPVTLPSGLMLLYRRILGVPVAMLPRAVPPPDLPAQLRSVGLTRTPLILSPEQSCKVGGVRLRAPQCLAEIDLRFPETARRRALHGKWRNQLGRAEGNTLRIRSHPMRADDPLPDQDAAQARKRGYRNWPPALTRAFASLNPDQTRLFTATHKGTPVAQMLFLLHGSTRATYHIGITTASGRQLHAHNLILWQAQNWLADRGVQRLDLGMIHRGTPDLNRFKVRAGAVEKNTAGTWLQWSPLARSAPP